MADVKISPQYTRELPLNGRLRTQEDPCTIGASDFQVLQNMRYTDTHIKGIGGMTKINTAAVANPQIRSGIFFRKDQVAESFTLIQALNSASAAPTIYVCTAAPPATGSFSSLYVQATAAGTARFSTAPGDKVVACDGVEALIYGGAEMKIAGFVDYDPNGTYRYDYTKQVTNSLTDANNVATVHRATAAVDSNTMLLLHFDGTAQDSSPTTPHAMGNVGVTYTTSGKYASAGVFTSTTYLSAASATDFNFNGGSFAIDAWLYKTNNAPDQTIYYQASGSDDNSIHLKCTVNTVEFIIRSASAESVRLTSQSLMTSNEWHHVQISENGNDYRLFLDGQIVDYLSSANRAPICNGNAYIGYSSNGFIGRMDEFRISNTPRNTAAFDPPSQPYGAVPISTFLVGSTLPVQGVKFYVASANTGTGATTANYWDGSTWVSVSSLSDGTSSSSKPLAQTGTVSFANTASLAKLKAEDDVLLYWYKVEMTNVDTTTTVYQVTVDTPMQTIKDIWDGEDRSVASFQVFKASGYNDYTTNVFDQGSYDSANTGTFADISSLAASAEYLYAGFTERMQGVKFGVVGASGNTTANVMTCEYYNGGDPALSTGWTSLSINDQTSVNNASLGQAGMVTWQPPTIASEYKMYLAGVSPVTKQDLINTINNSGINTGDRFAVGDMYNRLKSSLTTTTNPSKVQLYYYRFSFSVALDASTVLSYVAGIPAQELLRGYKFPVHHANRLWLCNNVDSEPNMVACSSVNTSQVFNGADSTKIYLGNNEGLIAGASLYTRVGSNIMNMLILCKYGETWAIVGETPENFIVYRVSDSIGCVAPETMKVISLGEGEVIGVPRNFAIWESAQGFVVFDGANITRVSDDIGDKFDPRSSTCVNSSYTNVGYGYNDPTNQEYHFFCVGAGASAINEEWVYDYRRKKWFQVVRANPLTCAFPVRDTLGNTYSYGADNTGFVFRLENGNAMNGNGIAQKWRFGDVALHKGSIMENTSVDWSVLVAKAKANATGTIAVTHYGDGINTGTSMNTVDPTNSGYRIVNVPIHSTTKDHTFHSFEFSQTTNDETVGVEPLFFGTTYKIWRREA